MNKIQGLECANFPTGPASDSIVLCESRRRIPFDSLSACTRRIRSSGCVLYVSDCHSPYSFHRRLMSNSLTTFHTSTVQTALPLINGIAGKRYWRTIRYQNFRTVFSGSGSPSGFLVKGSIGIWIRKDQENQFFTPSDSEHPYSCK